MKKKLTVALAAAALAVIPMTAAMADGHQSVVRVVHAVPGLDVDVWVNGAATIEGFSPKDVAGPLMLDAGDYDIEVFAAGSDYAEGEGAIRLQTTLEGGENLTIVAHPDGSDGFGLTAFPTDVSGIAAGEARIEVRHTADAGSVTLSSGDAELGSISLGQVFGPADVPAGDLPVTVTLDDGDVELLDTTLELADGSYTILHAFLDDAGFSVIPVSIPGLGAGEEEPADEEEVEQPTHVDSGTGGLADAGLPLWVSALMLVGALGLAVPAVATARRRS